MAALTISLSCRICKQHMNLPQQNLDIMDFVVLEIQFYKMHDMCEQREKALAASDEAAGKDLRKKKTRNK